MVIDICNELDKINNVEVKLLLFSNRVDFDDKTIKFDYSVISSHLRLSLKSSNQADLNELASAWKLQMNYIGAQAKRVLKKVIPLLGNHVGLYRPVSFRKSIKRLLK